MIREPQNPRRDDDIINNLFSKMRTKNVFRMKRNQSSSQVAEEE